MKFTIKNSSFADSLRKKVENYFRESEISEKGNMTLYVKTSLIITLFLFVYLLPLVTPLSLGTTLLTAGSLGIIISCIGFNIMHDGSHGSYSESKELNKIMSYSLELVGGSSYFWNRKHNITHHSYTNTTVDGDLEAGPALRFASWQTWHWWHRFQVFYALFLYSLLYLDWVWRQDIERYITEIKRKRKTNRMTLGQKWFFWICKVLHPIIFLLIPAVYIGFEHALISYLVMAITCGATISIVFQMAHVQRESAFKIPHPSTGNIEDEEWLIHQIHTTADFATSNTLISWFVGGLNFQREHHLFPDISHVHYKHIAEIVKDHCKEFGVKYSEYRTFTAVLIDHFCYLWEMSKKPIPM